MHRSQSQDQNPAMESPALRSGPMLDASSAFLLVVTIFVFFLPLLIYFPPVPPSQRDALLETHTPIGRHGPRQEAQDGRSGKGTPTVRSLCIYPIKSCKGIEVRQSKVLPAGLEFDRIYTFAQLKSPFPVGVHTADDDSARAHKWEFITQRQFPLLATLQVDLFVPDTIKARGRPSPAPVSDSDAFLLVSFPWQEPGLRGVVRWVGAKITRWSWRAQPEKEMLLPVAFPSDGEIETRGYAREQVAIWKETATALNMARELPPELRLYLGVSNRLAIFRIDPARLRPIHRCAPTKDEAGYQPVTGFQDAVRIFPRHPINGPIHCSAPDG